MTEVSQTEHAPLVTAQCAWAEGGWPASSHIPAMSCLCPGTPCHLLPRDHQHVTSHFSSLNSAKVQLIILFVNLDHSAHGLKLLGLLVSASPNPQAPLLPGSLAHSSKLGWATPRSLVLSQLLPTVGGPFCVWMLPTPQPMPACRIPACQGSLTHVAPSAMPCCVFHWDNVWIPLSVFSTFTRALKQSHLLCCVVIVTK